MSAEKKLKSLSELELQIGKRIKEFNDKRRKNQCKNKLYSGAQIWLSALTTLLIAINADISIFWLTVITLIVSSLSNVAGQLLSKFMYQERMAMNISTVCALYELRHAITMDQRKEEDDEAQKITLETVDIYQERYQQILNVANGEWQQYIQENKSKEK